MSNHDRQFFGVKTPIGQVLIDGDPALRELRFLDDEHDTPPDVQTPATVQLGEYFDGSRTEFELELDLEGTEFQLAVWREVEKIPYGETRTYLEIATALGDPNLTRAVGAANGANPVAIVIPCHRVIGADGSLTGYAGGLHRKRWLLELESAQTSLF